MFSIKVWDVEFSISGIIILGLILGCNIWFYNFRVYNTNLSVYNINPMVYNIYNRIYNIDVRVYNVRFYNVGFLSVRVYFWSG